MRLDRNQYQINVCCWVYTVFRTNEERERAGGEGERRDGGGTRSFANNYYCRMHWTGCLRDMQRAKRVAATRNDCVRIERSSLARSPLPSPSSLPVTNNRCSPSPCILRCMEVYRPIVGFFGFRVEFMVNFFAPLYRVDFVGRSVVYFVLKENDSMIWMTRVRCCGVELCTVVSIRINIVQVWDDNISGILNFEKFFRFFCNMNFNINGSFY